MDMNSIDAIQKKLGTCRACPKMCGTPVHGRASENARIMLIGQAPGPHEADRGKPFAHTAGKTLFGWLNSASGLEEAVLREQIYFAAVARCFPGKNPSGDGDREPDAEEIERCRIFLEAEVKVLRPELILAVGKLAIREVLGGTLKKQFTLGEVVGKTFFVEYHGHPVRVLPLPHPSGVSRWHKVEPGKGLLREALNTLTHYL